MAFKLKLRQEMCSGATGWYPLMFDMEVIARLHNSGICASITCMIRIMWPEGAEVIFDHPHNAAVGAHMVRASDRWTPAAIFYQACGFSVTVAS
jgi:hypothetical protein